MKPVKIGGRSCSRDIVRWLALVFLSSPFVSADEESSRPTFEELKAAGAQRSGYLKQGRRLTESESPQADLATYRNRVAHVLRNSCVKCHGPEEQEGNIRIDTLDPDLLNGSDVDWWLEILAVLTNGEMPPAGEAELKPDDRGMIVDWLSSEIQVASVVRRASGQHSSFRRMTRYEYNYALQDLLGLPYNFAKDLPPESSSEDGFQNSSETLHMTSVQFETYRELSRQALLQATVQGDRPPAIYWGVTMKDLSAVEWAKQEEQLKKLREQLKDQPDKLSQELERLTAGFKRPHNSVHYRIRSTGRTARATWGYPGAKYARTPAVTPVDVPTDTDCVAVIPPRQKLIVELGDRLPDEGTLQVRFRASRTSVDDNRIPSLQLEFGWQASNDSHASVRISDHDIAIDAAPDEPQFYEWRIPLSEIYPRNGVRGISKMGDLPSPSEYVKFVNSSVSHGDVQLDYVEVTAPVYDQWPPESHVRIFGDRIDDTDESEAARHILRRFMTRAWRRPATDREVEQKLALYNTMRPQCEDFHQTIVEVLATVLASPRFLYLVRTDQHDSDPTLGQDELATRLSMFLWCSTPDAELMELAAAKKLNNPDVLHEQVGRMLRDRRSRRFSEQFVRQWLGMQLLDYLKVDRAAHPRFEGSLKEAMREETVAFFHELLKDNRSVLDFVHADFTMANERLAQHYGLPGVTGNHFRRVSLQPEHHRGGLLTQAGLLAMNSDGKDSHPLKRGIWLLESLLNDPPPPPPPAVPEIDLADPEIAKLTLKQRIEKHRDHAACMSCHAKIDPWGIAFENFDATGSWRTQVDSKPVDATSVLFNRQELRGMDGLKRFLLTHRQDQLARALVHKMTTFALGRPLSFADYSAVDQITAAVRRQGDGLATVVTQIVTSPLFQSR